MAKLLDHKFGAEGKTGEKVEFSSSITVNSGGEFFLTFPSFLAETAHDLKSSYVVTHGKHRLQTDLLEEGIRDIKRMIDEYLHCETVCDFIIAYDYVATCAYVKETETGEIYPNGYGPGGEYTWSDKVGSKAMRHSCDPTDYTVGFKARVFRRLTHVRKATTKVTFENVRSGDVGHWGNKLNEFVHVSISTGRRNILPYTEETAKMFYESMLALCRFTDKLESYLKDPEKLMLVGSGGLLGPGSGREENNDCKEK